MDQVLKQRLIGVAVLTALAAIFLPMLFENPVEPSETAVSELSLPPMPDAEFAESDKDLPSLTQAKEPIPDEEALAVADEEIYTIEDAPEPAAESPENPPVLKPVRWFVQLGSFAKKENADELKAKLVKQGFPVISEAIQVPGKGRMYRLLAGPELDKEQAKRMQGRLDDVIKIKSLLVSE